MSMVYRKNTVKYVVLSLLFSLVWATCCFASQQAGNVKINALVIPSRNYASMQPQIYYAFMTSAKKVDPSLTMKFVLFNPFYRELSEEGPRFEADLTMFMGLLNQCVPEVVAIKKENPKQGNILKSIHDFVKKNPQSPLARLHRETSRLMRDFDFLIIESSDTYGVHPIYYVPNVTDVETGDGANEKDIIEALYGFFLVDAAFKQRKPVWGTCHGAQLGYVHAGGQLSRLFDYKNDGYDLDFKRCVGESGDVQVWHIDRWLFTHKKDTPYREYGTIICPAPDIIKGDEQKAEVLHINKDFEHSLAMTSPVPSAIEVLSYHPLSEYKEKNIGGNFKNFNQAFNRVLKNQTFIDAYKYNTMLGTQYHPQYTYDDAETYLLFEYLVKEVIKRKGLPLGGTSSSTPRKRRPLSPAVNDLKLLIENDPELYMLFTRMYEQAGEAERNPNYPKRVRKIKDYNQMLSYLNKALTQAPEFDEEGYDICLINDMFIGVMGTPAGQIAFLDPRVNGQLKKILNTWTVFLRSPASRYVLNDNPQTGWFGENAQKAMPDFAKTYICDPKAPHYGFMSWDDFFTRRLRQGARPVAEPDSDAIIVNPCESAPYKIAKNIQIQDTFWIKNQPYSLGYMLDGDPAASGFVGGVIYQAYLSATSYHRWHAPLSGTIIRTRVIDGTYFATCPGVGFDPVAPTESQGYLTAVATRALILIESDNPDIGLMALLFVGMGDVSSNEITVYEGQHVTKGDEIGMFHFGGSSYCMIFRPGVHLEFDLRGQMPGLESENIPVRSRIATVVLK